MQKENSSKERCRKHPGALFLCKACIVLFFCKGGIVSKRFHVAGLL